MMNDIPPQSFRLKPEPTSASVEQAVYRVRKFRRKGDLPKKYRYTLEMADDRTQQIMAACDLIGHAAFSTLAITDHENQIWQMKPNRKIMPSRWIVTDPREQMAMQFDQRILGKLVNPITKNVFVMLDAREREVYRILDLRTSIPDRMFGVGSCDYAIMAGEEFVAKMLWLPRQTEQPKGLLGKIKGFLASSDRGIVSVGDQHALKAPIALGMVMIFSEVVETKGE
jgi:hypothetical protein